MKIRSFEDTLNAIFQRLSELERRDLTAQLEGIIGSAMDAIITMNEDLRIVLFNAAAERMFRCSAEAAVGQSVDIFIPQRFHRIHREHVRVFGETQVTSRRMGALGTITGLRADGEEFPIEASVSQVEAGGKKLYTVILRDITERKRAEDHLRQSLQQTRLLAQRLETVREEERTRIAREIHDELGIRLTCLKFDLIRLSALASESSSPEALALLQDKIGAMSRQTDETITRVQRLATELRPGILDDLGLVAALEWQAHDFQDRTGIVCSLQASHEDFHLDQDRTTALFRNCQEALTNVARHSGGSHAAIRVSEADGRLVLEVKDDGIGISEEKISDARSLGLIGMRERVLPFDGEVRIAGIPGEGTTLTVSMLLPRPPLEPGGDEHGSRTPRGPAC